MTCHVNNKRICKGLKVEERTEDFDARTMDAFQLNTKKSKKHTECDNNKQQKNTQLLAAGRNELGEHSAKCYTKRVRRPFHHPPYPFTYHL